MSFMLYLLGRCCFLFYKFVHDVIVNYSELKCYGYNDFHGLLGGKCNALPSTMMPESITIVFFRWSIYIFSQWMSESFKYLFTEGRITWWKAVNLKIKRPFKVRGKQGFFVCFFILRSKRIVIKYIPFQSEKQIVFQLRENGKVYFWEKEGELLYR